MPRRNALFVSSLLAICLVIPPSAFAQGHRSAGMGRHPQPHAKRSPNAPKPNRNSGVPAQIDEFARMSPERRQEALAKLPPDRAEKLRKQLEIYGKMTPEQQAAAREQLNAFRSLPPERQEGMRKAFSKFSREPAERQQAIRQELNQLRALPEADRQTRLNSPELKQRFSNNERKIIRDLSDLPLNE
jgi:hypothetical protein